MTTGRDRTRTTASAVVGLVAALLLTGCTTHGSTQTETAAPDGAAARFLACLQVAGVDAKLLDGGQVAVHQPGTNDAGSASASAPAGGDTGWLTASVDADGTQWIATELADGQPEEGGIRASYQACEAEVPDFVQPEPKGGERPDPTEQQDQVTASLAFAACARENGFADFRDPSAEGALLFPAGITEDDFATLLGACYASLGGANLMIDSTGLDFDWMAVVDRVQGSAP